MKGWQTTAAWTRPAFRSSICGKRPNIHALAAAMITAIAEVLERHPVDGFAHWEDRWRRRDWLSGRRIEAVCSADSHVGEAAGVDSSGALLLRDSDGERRILSAEIRL